MTAPGPASREVALVDLLDRLLAGGVVITGDLVLSIADVDLVEISLRAVIRSVAEGVEGGELAWSSESPAIGSTPTMTRSNAT